MKKFAALAAFALASPLLWAAPQTVTLSVPGMNCAACPITVKKALLAVPGVSKAEVNYDKRTATVSFDNAKASVDALRDATEDAGYPSTLAGEGK